MNAKWATRKLGEVLEIQNGCAFDSKRFNAERGLPLVRIRSLKLGVESETYYDGPYEDRYLVRPGDLLIGMDGEFGCYEWRGEESLLNQRVCRLQGFTSDIHPRFLLYGLNAHLKRIEEFTGYSTVKHLSSRQVLAIDFPMPPLSDQRRIVRVLDEAFEALANAQANTEKNLHNARQLFGLALRQEFALGQSPLQEVALEQVCTFGSGGTPSKTKASYWNGQIPWVSGRDMKGTTIIDTTLHIAEAAVRESATKVVPRGTVLVLVRGMGLAHGPQVAELAQPCAFNQDIRAVYPSSRVASRYLMYALRARMQMDSELLSAAAHGTLKVDSERLKSLSVPAPPMHKQLEVSRRLDEVEEMTRGLAEQYSRKLAALAALKQSLLHAAFTGQL